MDLDWGIDGAVNRISDGGDTPPLLSAARLHKSFVFEAQEGLTASGWTEQKRVLLERLGNRVADVALSLALFEDTVDAGQASSRKNELWLAYVGDAFRLGELELVGLGNRVITQELRAGTMGRSVVESLAMQVIGASASSGDAADYEALAHRFVADHASRSDKVLDFKSALQEALGKPPTYKTLRREGPDHDVHFVVGVSDGRGRSAKGKGVSKKKAGQDAAESFFRHHLPESLTAATAGPAPRQIVVGAKQSDNSYVDRLPEQAQQVVERLAHELEVPAVRVQRVAYALTHSSYLFEMRDHLGDSSGDQAHLAWLGSAVIPAMMMRELLDRVLPEPPPDLDPTVRLDLTDAALARLFDSWALESCVLLGRGQQQSGLTPSIKAQTVQALLACWALERGVDGSLVEPLPVAVQAWVEETVDAGLRDPDAGIDPKTRLQEFAAVLRVADPQYAVKRSGPDHQRQFVATVHLPLGGGARLSATGSVEPNRTQAEQAAAAGLRLRLGRVLAPLNPADVRGLRSIDQRSTALALAAAVEALQQGAAHAARVKLRIMGVGLITRPAQRIWFIRWTKEVASLLPDTDPGKALEKYYRSASLSLLVRPDPNESVTLIRSMIEEINPEQFGKRIQQHPSFTSFRQLLAALRLSAAAWTTETLVGEVEGLELTRRLSPGLVQVDDQASTSVLRARDGALGDLLSRLVEAGVESIVIGKTELPGFVEVSWSSDFDPFEEGSFASRTLDLALSLPVSKQGAVLLPTVAGTNVILDAAAAALGSDEESERQARALASVLHDIKNHLLAIDVALAERPEDPTERAERRLEATKHQARACELLAMAEFASRAFVQPVFATRELNEFFRDLGLAETRSLPSNVRLIPPSSRAHCEVDLAFDWIRSIVVNLCRNSANALDGEPGDVALEWIVDDENLIVEVEDTGPGVPEAVLGWLGTGFSARPSTEHGSGLGLLTIHSLLRRLGGRLEATNLNPGSRWTVQVPLGGRNVDDV